MYRALQLRNKVSPVRPLDSLRAQRAKQPVAGLSLARKECERGSGYLRPPSPNTTTETLGDARAPASARRARGHTLAPRRGGRRGGGAVGLGGGGWGAGGGRWLARGGPGPGGAQRPAGDGRGDVRPARRERPAGDGRGRLALELLVVVRLELRAGRARGGKVERVVLEDQHEHAVGGDGRRRDVGVEAMGAAALPSSSSLSSASGCAPGAPAAGRSSASYLRTSMSTSAAATGGVGTSASTRRRPERPCPRWRGAVEALEPERAACGHGADFAGSGAAGRGRAGVGVDLEREPRLIRAAGGRWGGQEGFEGLGMDPEGADCTAIRVLGGSRCRP